MKYTFVFWQEFINHSTMPFIRALSERKDSVVKLFYLEDIPEGRKTFGWTIPYNGKVICEKVGDNAALKRAIISEKESIHIFGGYIGNRVFQDAILLALAEGSKIGVMSETPVIQKSGVLKLLKMAHIERMSLTNSEIKRGCSFLLKISDDNDNSFIRMGWKAEKIYNFGYFSDDIDKKPRVFSNKEPIKMMYCGRFLEHKGVMTLLKAAKILKNKGMKFHCKFIGKGPLDNKLKRMVYYEKLHPHVEIIAPMTNEEIRNEMKKNDIYVAPGVVEPWGLPVNEAIQAGMAVVVSDGIRGGSCLVKASDCGYVFKAKNDVELATYLQILLQNSDLLKKKQLAAEEYRRRISPSCVSEYFMEIISHLEGNKKLRPRAPWLN